MLSLKVHPAAEVFPLVSGEELRKLADDIRAYGLRDAIVVADKGANPILLDGRNRLEACRIAGVQPRFEYYGGNDPVGFIISKNMVRRHLTDGQKAAVAAALVPFYSKETKTRVGGRPRKGEEKPVADLQRVSEWETKRLFTRKN